MKNDIVFPSSLVESTLPNYIYENYNRFVDFMTKSAEAQERIGFGQDLLQNLLRYKNFDTYKNKIVEKGVLVQRIDKESDELELVDGYGFPENNGILLIEDEIILYRYREGNFFYELQRGASATTVLPTLKSSGTYKKTCPADHNAGAEVYNISVLFLLAMLDNIHKTYAPGIDSLKVNGEINRSSLLQNIRDFYQSKGTKLGIKSLFKILFADNDVDVSYPGDRMIVPSKSSWSKNLIMRVVPVPLPFCDPTEDYLTPDKVIGSEVLFKSYNDDKIYARTVCEYVSSYPFGSEVQYEMVLNEDSFAGEIIANPKTRLTRELFRIGTTTDDRDVTTITVESTIGFPESGVLFIDNEAIYYTSKSFNQFFGCTRGYLGVEDGHPVESIVYGPYYIETSFDYGTEVNGCDVRENKGVSRSWPLGLVTSVKINDPGLLHRLDDEVIVNGPGKEEPREPILRSIIENYNDDLATQTQAPPALGYIGNYTHGVNGVYYDDDFVYIASSNLPKYSVGPFSSDGSVGLGLQGEDDIHVIPRREKIEKNLTVAGKGTGEIGVFVDGVPAYSNIGVERIQQGSISKFVIENAGSGYVNPTVIIDPPLSGANAVVEEGRVTAIIPTSVGDYRYNPEVRISSGEGATFSLQFDNFGRLTNVTIVNRGQYYNDVPSLRLVDESGRGKGCIIAAEVAGGEITNVNIVKPGIDYRPGSCRVEVTPRGSGASIKGYVQSYRFDRYRKVLDDPNKTFDRGNGFIWPGPDGDLNKFGYITSPTELRRQLNDRGVTHSPIIGWAYDGNPIYGPYGYLNGVDESGGIERQISGYQLHPDRTTVNPSIRGVDLTNIGTNPPSEIEYPMGTFVEDYFFFGTTLTLDEFNGKVCNTPEFPQELYPDGVYCYFLTVDSNEIPQFPYILGDNFKNRPVSQNIDRILQETIIPLEDSTNFEYLEYDNRKLYFDYEKVNRLRSPFLSQNNQEIDVEISGITDGSVSEVLVQVESPLRTSPGDYVYFDERDTGGSGVEAKVEFVRGKKVTNTGGCIIATRLLSHRQRLDLSNNLGSSYVFVPNSFFETTSGARARVTEYNPISKVLEVQTTTENRILPGDIFYDNRGQRVVLINTPYLQSYGDSVVNMPETNNISIVSFVEPDLRYDDTPLEAGDLWWSVSTGRLYVFFDDGDTRQWVCTQPLGTIPMDGASNYSIGNQGPVLPFSGTPPEDSVVTISEIAPANRSDGTPNRVGDLWWSSLTGILYIWNSDILGCISCGCDANGDNIEITSEWVCTDPAGIIPMDGASDDLTLRPYPFSGVRPIYSTSVACVVSDLAPTQRNNGLPLLIGDLWWSPLTGKMYIYFDDGDTIQWVVTNPSGMLGNQFSSDDGYYDDGRAFGPYAFLPEKPDRELLFFEGICDFLLDDNIRFLRGAPGAQWPIFGPQGEVIGTQYSYEDAQIEAKNSNKSMFIRRGDNPIFLPDRTITQNMSRAKYTITTIEPHKLRRGDIVRIENASIEELNADHVVIDGGVIEPAFGYARVAGGEVIGVDLVDAGWNYSKNFYISFIGGGGVGAYAQAFVAPLSEGGYIKQIVMIDGGVNYTSEPIPNFLYDCDNTHFTIYTSRPYGPDPALIYSTSAFQCEGGPAYIKVTSGGVGFDKLPVPKGLYKREIDRAQVKVNLNGTEIASVEVLDGGNRYSLPTAIFDDLAGSGYGAQATVSVDNGRVTGINVTDNGTNYLEPVVTLVEEAAKLIPLTETIGQITSFRVLNPGRNLYADKSLKPELKIDTRVIFLYETPIVFDLEGDFGFYQGLVNNKLCEADVIAWDEQLQMLTLRNVNGTIREGEMAYVYNKQTNFIAVQAEIVLEGQADCELEISGVAKPEGRFIDETSHISSSYAVVQDSYYYQLFSYVISSSIQQVKYKRHVDEVIHPAGFIMFSDTLIRDDVVTQCRAEEIDLIGSRDVIRDIVVSTDLNPPSNPRVGNLWYRPTDGKLYIFYYDGGSYQWVKTNPDLFRPIGT